MGLGDRHGENMLFDASSGDVVHVDFSCLFDKVWRPCQSAQVSVALDVCWPKAQPALGMRLACMMSS